MSAKGSGRMSPVPKKLSAEDSEESISRSLKALNTTDRAFVDEQGVRWDTNNADFEGYLYKKSKWIGEWRKRWCILKGSKLFFSKSNNSSPHGMIDLVECVTVKSAEHKAQKRNAFEITLKEDQFLLYANTDKEKDEWIGRVGKAIVKHSSMYVTEERQNSTALDDEEDDGDAYNPSV